MVRFALAAARDFDGSHPLVATSGTYEVCVDVDRVALAAQR
ncbi:MULTISPECIES: hypothetical protein [unclassified Frankia]|nr:MULTISPECIES: hypothetical protein [unclassified Frankia]